MFLDALQFKNNSGKPPVWLMRQAGRYLPEYRALRREHQFMDMVKNPKVASLVTMQPIQRFQFDAAILFSDILVLPDALGMPVQFKESIGPVFSEKLDLQKLKKGSVAPLSYVKEAIYLIKAKADVPLIGFAGAPFTVASYMIEGGVSKDHAKTKAFALKDTNAFLELMAFLSDKTIEYLEMQVSAGVNAIQLFDTWAGILSNKQFKELSLPFIKRIVDTISQKVPVILFSKASTAYADAFSEAKPQGIGFDITADLSEQRKRFPRMVIQGNLDPDVLLTSPEIVRREAKKILSSMKNDPGFIFNLGHGILPETPLECVQALLDEIRS